MVTAQAIWDEYSKVPRQLTYYQRLRLIHALAEEIVACDICRCEPRKTSHAAAIGLLAAGKCRLAFDTLRPWYE